MFFVLSRVWDKDKILNQTSDLWVLCFDTPPLSHRDSMVSKVYWGVHMTCVLHAARISDVSSVMSVNRIRKMVSFDFRKEIEKDVFLLVTSMGQRKNTYFNYLYLLPHYFIVAWLIWM